MLLDLIYYPKIF